jgi:hypothetical protein
VATKLKVKGMEIRAARFIIGHVCGIVAPQYGINNIIILCASGTQGVL